MIAINFAIATFLTAGYDKICISSCIDIITYLIILCNPSMCHKESGALTLYTLRVIDAFHLVAILAGEMR